MPFSVQKIIGSMEIKNSCDICNQTVDLFQTTGFSNCLECRQLMCDNCVQIHKKFSITKLHNVKPVQSSTDSLGLQQGSLQDMDDETSSKHSENNGTDSPCQYQNGKLLTCSIHDKRVELYCTKHEEPLCKTCKLIEHRKCTSFMALEEAADNGSSAIEDALEGIQVVRNELFKVNKAKVFAKENLFGKKQQIMVQLQQLRERFNQLENNTITELEHIYENSANDLGKDTDMIGKTQELVDQLRKQLDSIGQSGSKEEQFVAAKSAEKELKKYSEVLDDTSVVTLTDIHFTPHVFWKQIEQLGELGEEKMSHQLGLTKFIPYDISLKIDTDQEDAFISALDLLEDGRKLLLDVTNNKLKLFSASNKFLSEVTFQDEVYDVALLNDSTALATVPSLKENSLQKVSITDDVLKIEGHMQIMNTHPNLVARLDEKTFLTVSIKDNKVIMTIADHTGQVQKAMASATGIKKMIKQPITAQASADQKRVYILDLYNGCIIIDIPGMKVSQHRDLLYDFHGGMAVGTDGCVYMECGRKENDLKFSNILQLTPEGQVVRKLFNADISPRIVPLKIVGKKMYAFTKTPEKGMVLGCFHHYLL